MKKKSGLNKRQKDILGIIITSHIRSAAPIGSGLVSKVLDLSSATIRNVMGELEDMGYICKPHTSAGRVPTTAGYRFYVDELLRLHAISARQRKFIQGEYRKAILSLDAMLDKLSHLLSMLTRQAGIACVSNLKFYLDGASNMLDMPEFRDPERMKMLLKLLDDKDELIRLLDSDLGADGVKIHIGEEGRFKNLKNLSLITSNYKVSDSTRGSLGVIGPVRMDYSSLIPLVDFLSRAIEAAFEDMERYE